MAKKAMDTPETGNLDFIKVAAITADHTTQVRVRLIPDVIDEYAEALKAGDEFPPLVVFIKPGSQDYILADGFHRLRAHKALKVGEIWADVHSGGIHDALAYALAANAEHGLRRTQADKRHAVQMAMRDPEFGDWSSRQMAQLCNVSHTLVIQMRRGDTTKSRKATDKDKRKSKKPPSQKDQDRYDLQDAIQVIKSFPYAGKAAIKKMGLVKNDATDIAYAAEWIADLAKAIAK